MGKNCIKKFMEAKMVNRNKHTKGKEKQLPLSRSVVSDVTSKYQIFFRYFSKKHIWSQ